jgi:saccharopine dehydrogenase-like NADP-dependent oxidoreductase
VLKDILENALPGTTQDVVLVFVTVSGHRGGRLVLDSCANKIYSRTVAGRTRSAIQITTASGICAVREAA